MKFEKKVIEGAVVIAFALVIAYEAVPTKEVTDVTKQYTNEEILPETGLEAVSKTRMRVDVVSVPKIIAESEEEAEEFEKIHEETVKSEPAEETERKEESSEETEKPEAAEETKKEAEKPAEETEKETGKPAEETEKETGKPAKETEKETGKPAEETEVAVEEVSEWETRLMPDVEEFLNIRGEAGEEAEVVGKLYKGAAADILERGEEWSKISSGSVEGFVKNDFCKFDEEAESMAYELGTVYATALTGGLRVRAEGSDTEETKILNVLEEGEKIEVDNSVEAPEDWIAVVCSDQTAFVSEQYVSVELELGRAISIEEEQAAIKAAEEEEARKAAEESQQSAQGSDVEMSQNEAVSASYDDVTLLGALIQCEAGSECYEGQLAVGAVVMNRLRNGYAGSISGVIYQSGQFTPASSGALAGVLASGVSGSCMQAAQEAVNGVDNVGGATSFRRADSGNSGIVIGNHVFF